MSMSWGQHDSFLTISNFIIFKKHLDKSVEFPVENQEIDWHGQRMAY